VVASAGCRVDLETHCAEGTFPASGLCLPYDPKDNQPPVTSATPAPGAVRSLGDVRLATNEPATIFFTIDGTAPGPDGPSQVSPAIVSNLDPAAVIRVSAVDLAGNVEPEQTISYTIDLQGPDRVQGFTAALSGLDVALSWTPPSDPDYAAVVLVELAGVAVPQDGVFYQAGDTFDGATVLYAGPAVTFTRAQVAPGAPQFAIWAHDAVGNYSPISIASVQVPLPAQTAHIRFFPGTGRFEVVSPPNLGMTPTGTFNPSAATATIAVAVENQTSRALFNLKAVFSSVLAGPQGAQTARSISLADGTLGSNEYRYYGPQALAVGAARSRDVVITSVGADDVIDMDIEFHDAPLLIGGGTWSSSTVTNGPLFDTETGQLVGHLPDSPRARGFRGTRLTYRGGALSPDSTRLYLGSRTASVISEIDLTTMTVASALVPANLNNARAAICDLAVAPAVGELYALLMDGAHCARFSTRPNQILLVRFDNGLNETGRLELLAPIGDNARNRGRRMAITSDQRLLAVPVVGDGAPGRIHLVDLTTFAEVDTNPVALGIQPILFTTDFNPVAVVFSKDGRRLFAAGNNNGTSPLADINLADFSVSLLKAVDHPGLENRTRSLAVRGDGQVVFGQNTITRVYNPSTGQSAALPGVGGVAAMVTTEAGTLAYMQRANDFSVVDRIDLSTGAVLQTVDSVVNMFANRLTLTPF
jgi:hypothetical protein